jgi:hypothetical protein
MRKATLKLEGKRFGLYVVLSKGSKPRYWVTKCDCGKVTETRGSR